MFALIQVAFTFRDIPYSVSLQASRAQTCLLEGDRKRFAFAPKRLNPWQLKVCDIDANGKIDMLVGIFKQTHLIPHPHKTVFIYEFDGSAVRAKWKASTLGRDLIDFAPAQLENKPRFISVERNLNNTQSLAEWKWRGFGLYKVKDLAVGKTIKLQSLPWPAGIVEAKVDGKTLKWKR